MILLGAFLASVLPAAPVRADDCPAFLLARGDDGVKIPQERVPAGEVRVWTAGVGAEVLDLVLPVGPGGSGSLLKRGETVLYAVRCTGAGVSVQLRYPDHPDSRQVDRPLRTLDDLRSQDVRVSVVEGSGERSAFVIEAYDRVVADHGGPVQNLLADAIPLAPGDVVVTTDTYPGQATPVGVPAVGEVALDVSGHLYTRGAVPGGEAAWFLVDTGGAGSLVARSFLPDGLPVEPVHTLEYSARGVRELEYAPGGATGQVAGVLGQATLPRLVLGAGGNGRGSTTAGTIELADVQVAVVDTMPDLFDRPVAGIVGIDLLERTGRVIFRLPPDAEGSGRLRLAPSDASGPATEGAFEVPFTVVNRHLTLSAILGGGPDPDGVREYPAHFILDTGAPGVLLDQETAEAAGVLGRGEAREVGGLDGGKAASSACVIPRITVAGTTFETVSCRTASLPVFAPFRGGDRGIGLLGNAFLGRFERVEIDFARERVRFVPRHAEATGR